MHWFKRFCAVLILIPTATCIFGGFTKEILQGLHILPRLNKTCISPFADDSINIIQIVEDVVKGFLGKCPYRPGSESVASQLSDYVNFYVLARLVSYFMKISNFYIFIPEFSFIFDRNVSFFWIFTEFGFFKFFY